jgi:hypothetical protein
MVRTVTPDQIRGDKTEKFVTNISSDNGVKTQHDNWLKFSFSN